MLAFLHRGKDRYRLLPSVIGLGFSLVFFSLVGIPGKWNFLLAFAGMALIPVIGIIWAAILIAACVKRSWRSAVSFLIVPLLIVALHPALVSASNFVHLALFKRHYDREVATLHYPPGQRYGVFDWSVGFAGGPLTLLIYDETDQIALPLKKRVPSMDGRRDWDSECGGRVEPLFDHYYLCEYDPYDDLRPEERSAASTPIVHRPDEPAPRRLGSKNRRQ